MADQLYEKDEITLDAFNVEKPQPTPDLPPAGWKRKEELAKRTDALEEQAAEKYKDVEAINSRAFDKDRDIQRAISRNYLEIGTDHPYLKVKWVNYVNQQGTHVWNAKAEGWQVADPRNFPEAEGLVREDNTIRIGDVLLMQIRFDDYQKLVNRDAEKRRRQELGIEHELSDIAARYPNEFKVHTEHTTGIPDRINEAMRAGAKRVAANTIGNRLKKGTIPGVPIK